MTHPRRIYRPGYAAGYDAIYLAPWQGKHAINEQLLGPLIDSATRHPGFWLDLGCGQAWQFQLSGRIGFGTRLPRLGVDLSPAQLVRARRRNPQAQFLCADMDSLPLPPGCCSLVTCFWGAYCYLDNVEAIARLTRRAIEWTVPGGSLYFEILPPENLEQFNQSDFALGTGFRVEPRGADYSRWLYEDRGGRHLMTSPPTSMFADLLTPSFETVETLAKGFMVHLVGRGRG